MNNNEFSQQEIERVRDREVSYEFIKKYKTYYDLTKEELKNYKKEFFLHHNYLLILKQQI